MPTHRPVMLVILDGWGWREERADNAVLQANTPTFDRIWATCPHALLHTSGNDVGLPPGQMGNSEVGHLNIGAGRVVMQELPRIDHAIESGELAKNPVLGRFIEKLKQTGGTCHLMGLVSPGGVHSHQNHAVALAKILEQAGIPVAFHAFMDGRDTPPRAGAEYMARLVADLPPAVARRDRHRPLLRDGSRQPLGARVESLRGRRRRQGRGLRRSGRPRSPTRTSKDVTDEFILPAVIGGYQGMRDGDGVLCFNFRADRVRELLAAILDPEVFRLPALRAPSRWRRPSA